MHRRSSTAGRAGHAGRAGWSSTAATPTSTGSAPAGPGRQVVIGGPDARYRGVRDLIGELALMPVEGGARVAIIEGAERMNEDAQSALLKTLEEPPAGVTIILCADGEARLLPTVRSRCFRVRLGLVGAARHRGDPRATTAWPIRRPPPGSAGSRAGGPGLALAYARAPEAVLIRAELTRVLLDLHRCPPVRPAGRSPGRDPARDRPGRPRSAPAMPVTAPARPTRRRGPAAAAARRPRVPTSRAAAERRRRPATTRRRVRPTRRPVPPADPGRPSGGAASRSCSACGPTSPATSPWSGSGGARSVHDTVLLEELTAIAGRHPAGPRGGVPGARAARRPSCSAGNVSPELVLDALVLAWPSRSAAA